MALAIRMHGVAWEYLFPLQHYYILNEPQDNAEELATSSYTTSRESIRDSCQQHLVKVEQFHHDLLQANLSMVLQVRRQSHKIQTMLPINIYIYIYQPKAGQREGQAFILSLPSHTGDVTVPSSWNIPIGSVRLGGPV